MRDSTGQLGHPTNGRQKPQDDLENAKHITHENRPSEKEVEEVAESSRAASVEFGVWNVVAMG